MAKISQYPDGSTPQDTDLFVIARAGQNFRILWSAIRAVFAPVANGVDNGNSHDHSMGDGAQIAYSTLSGLPTLGSSAAKDVGIGASDVAAGDRGVTGGDAHNHVGGDGGTLYYSDVLGAHGLLATIAASGTQFLCPFVTGLQAVATTLGYPEAGTLKNCYFRIAGTQPASGSLVCTLTVNGVATAIVVTVPAGSTTGTFSDTTHTAAISAGDRIGWTIVNNASGTSAQVGFVSVGVEKQTT